VGQSTKFKTPSASDFELAFDMFIDMLDMWEAQGFKLYGNRPTGMQNTIGSEEPLVALYRNLALMIASQYFYEPSQLQRAQADNALRSIRNRRRRPPCMSRPSRMPRGSNNYWYNFYFFDYYDNDENGVLENNQGAVLVVP